MAKFELISNHSESAKLPVRKTEGAAGYDFFVAEDTIVPPLCEHHTAMSNYVNNGWSKADPYTIEEMATITKGSKAKPTLVPTGVKAKLDDGTYLELSVRSSCPLKYWLILANGVGIIDSDYYNNPDNEGHIYFQIINLTNYPIKLNAGDCIGQGIIKPYLTTEDDEANGDRKGGFGSTDA